MAFALVYSRALMGVSAPLVRVEVHLANGLPQFNLVGLPDKEVRESRERVRAALTNCNFRFPARRITVNLAPADFPKQSSRFDLPIALGILAASGQLDSRVLEHYEFAGELALSGELRPVHGALPMAMAVGMSGRKFVLPAESAAEGALGKNVVVLPACHLSQLCRHLNGEETISIPACQVRQGAPDYPDMRDVMGQQHAKRALEIAAAGHHHVLMMGPPGSGKSMLATRMNGIFPAMTDQESLESAAMLSSAREPFSLEQWGMRPFRHPHHTVTTVAMAGGGARIRPGEISLAHCGILYLDEMGEFDRRVLETLREPLETGFMTVSRAAHKLTYPAKFQLVAAMNPCPCGYRGHFSGRCHCTPEQVRRYCHRLSGPLLDRIDLLLEVPALTAFELRQYPEAESSGEIRVRVEQAAQRQQRRQGRKNGRLEGVELERRVPLETGDREWLARAAGQFGLSARSVHGVLRVALTIADLEGRDRVGLSDLGEALGYRRGLSQFT